MSIRALLANQRSECHVSIVISLAFNPLMLTLQDQETFVAPRG